MHRLYDDFLTQDAPEPFETATLLQALLVGCQLRASRMGIQLAAAFDPSIKECDIPWLAINFQHIYQIIFALVTNTLDAAVGVVAPIITVSMSATFEEPPQLENQAPDVTIPTHLEFNTRAWQVCAKAQALDPAKPVYLRFTVQDNCTGISREAKGNLFTQGVPKFKHSYGPDLGHGLFSAKQLVEMQSGKISFTSEEGVGSTFAFYIKTFQTQELDDTTRAPLARAVEFAVRDFCSRDRTVIHFRSPSILSGLESILVVEDNLVNQKVITKQLKKHRHIVHVANNGQEGLEILAVYNTKKGKARDGTQIAFVLVDDFVSAINAV
jgi:hypothetical protein